MIVYAVLFSVAAVIPIISDGRSPIPEIVVVCVFLYTVLVNGTPAAEPLAVVVVVADFF